MTKQDQRGEEGFDRFLDMSAAIYAPALQWDDFEKLLEKMSLAVTRFIERQCQNLDGNIKRIFFGAGGHGRYLLKHCRALGVEPDYFCDNDIAPHLDWIAKSSPKQHSWIDGLYSLAPDDLKSLENTQVIVATSVPRFRHAIKRQLREMDVSLMPEPECYLYEAIIMNSYIDFYQKHLGALREVYDLLYDDRSRFVYLSVLKGRIVPYQASESICFSIMESGQYWPFNEFKNLPNATFVDAGAHSGDTVTTFIYNNIAAGFKRIYAFEPDDAIFKRLSNNVRHLSERFSFAPEKIQTIHGGLGCFLKNPPSLSLMRKVADNPLSMPQTMALLPCEPFHALDDFLDGRPVTFLKADIEGYEEDLICGAEASIRKDRPNLAICVYHLPTDIFVIPQRLKRLAPEYKMAVRHHACDLSETVLYCWI